MDSQSRTTCGFIAILGAPNVGKSTLLNRIVGTKVSIVSSKVQTTRTRVLGISLEGGSQLIFIDTPGIFLPKRRLDRAMVAAAWGGAGDADRIMLLIDSKRGVDSDTQLIIDKLKNQGAQSVDLVLNKIDLVDKQKLLGLTETLNNYEVFENFFMVSAEKGEGVGDLVTYLKSKMPISPWLFPEDQISDMPMRLLAAEITREQLFIKLHQELPYAATVETETWEEKDDGSIRIEQTIYVERGSQRSIVLGKNGKMIKSIGAESRRELADIVDAVVHLFLFVKVREKWGDDPSRYSHWGLDFNA
ncbi:MAG TPA: GTPase Era [Rhodospirillales bacterium]|nr:GTPase Era [Rhodospirillales bacterium]